jgi:hypothetical protein
VDAFQTFSKVFYESFQLKFQDAFPLTEESMRTTSTQSEEKIRDQALKSLEAQEGSKWKWLQSSWNAVKWVASWVQLD